MDNRKIRDIITIKTMVLWEYEIYLNIFVFHYFMYYAILIHTMCMMIRSCMLRPLLDGGH